MIVKRICYNLESCWGLPSTLLYGITIVHVMESDSHVQKSYSVFLFVSQQNFHTWQFWQFFKFFKFWIGDINDISLKIRLRGGKGRFFLVLFSFLAIRIFVSEKDYYVKFGWRSMSIIIIKNGAKSWHLSMKFIFRYVFKRKKEDKIFLRKIINVHYDRWYHLLSMEN